MLWQVSGETTNVTAFFCEYKQPKRKKKEKNWLTKDEDCYNTENKHPHEYERYHDPRMRNINCPSCWCNKNSVTSLRIPMRNPIILACTTIQYKNRV